MPPNDIKGGFTVSDPFSIIYWINIDNRDGHIFTRDCGVFVLRTGIYSDGNLWIQIYNWMVSIDSKYLTKSKNYLDSWILFTYSISQTS